MISSFEQPRQTRILTMSHASIRLWWKKTFQGYNGPVSTLSDKLLGDGSDKVLASGGEDGPVRIWFLSTSGKRGNNLRMLVRNNEAEVYRNINIGNYWPRVMSEQRKKPIFEVLGEVECHWKGSHSTFL
uniref:Uncharacterized protein n=1 Tax=Cucumis melo TaxID=3656 RepID=A0A9I9EA76_CUCME